MAALVGLATHFGPRLKDLDLGKWRLTLSEMKEVKKQLETTKDEIVEMYGGIENLQREPLVLDSEKREELGLREGLSFSSAAMRYPVGCIKRERERLASIFGNEKSPEAIAEAIVDNSKDDNVFKWNGPEVPLDEPPKSVEQRKQVASPPDAKPRRGFTT